MTLYVNIADGDVGLRHRYRVGVNHITVTVALQEVHTW